MNLAGHIAVARRLSDDPAVWLGAALPDLGAMGRFRLLGTTDSEALAEGIAIHHRTDDAFHGSPWFRERQDHLTQRLEGTEGMARGAARAVAHVGPELLLDGALLQAIGSREVPELGLEVDRAFGEIGIDERRLRSLVIKNHDAWLAHLGDVTAWQRPADYHEPEAVARRLERILSRRPRLRLLSEHVDLVGRELAAINPQIGRTAADLVDELVVSVEQAMAADRHNGGS